MKRINLTDRKRIQLDILDIIHSFCTENHINYSLGYGSLLGAIRHGGYIPWDDDIDIVMLREDYDKFISTFNSNRYKVASVDTNKDWFLPFAKVYDDMTLIIDRKAHTTAIGVNVDVFPIDDAMESEKEFLAIRRYMKILTTCNNIKLFKINNETTFYNNLLGVLGKCILLIFPNHFFTKKITSISQRYNGKGYSKAVYWATVGNTRQLDKSVYEDLCERRFENHIYKSICNYDKYLSNIYGNYMVLPPKEKRISYHTNDAYWK